MIAFGSEARVFVSMQPVDFRKGVHGLIAMVAENFKAIPMVAIFSSSARRGGIG
jgi:transposase